MRTDIIIFGRKIGSCSDLDNSDNIIWYYDFEHNNDLRLSIILPDDISVTLIIDHYEGWCNFTWCYDSDDIDSFEKFEMDLVNLLKYIDREH